MVEFSVQVFWNKMFLKHIKGMLNAWNYWNTFQIYIVIKVHAILSRARIYFIKSFQTSLERDLSKSLWRNFAEMRLQQMSLNLQHVDFKKLLKINRKVHLNRSLPKATLSKVELQSNVICPHKLKMVKLADCGRILFSVNDKVLRGHTNVFRVTPKQILSWHYSRCQPEVSNRDPFDSFRSFNYWTIIRFVLTTLFFLLYI